MKENHDIEIHLFDEVYGMDGLFVRDTMTLREIYDLVKDYNKHLESGHTFKPVGFDVYLDDFMDDA